MSLNAHPHSNEFYIHGESLWRLSKLSHPKKFIIKIYEKLFYFSKAQIVFLSNAAFEHFKNSFNPFELIPPDSFQSNEVLSCFNSLYSLFFDSISIEINLLNQKYFNFLGKNWTIDLY
jgi:hypothetical protein